MKRLLLLTILSLSLFKFIYGQDTVIIITYEQDDDRYFELVTEAWDLYQNKDYLKSSQKYSEAFAEAGGAAFYGDRYNASCSWALANRPDSAFAQLFIIAENDNFNDLYQITTDSMLNSLHNDKRWNEIIEIIKTNKDKAEANLDKTLVAILDTVIHQDQGYRGQADLIEEKYGLESDEMKALWKIINKIDSINLIKVKKILDEQGWLGADVVGRQGNETLFLVIQHSDLVTQEKYLPMMREAVKNGNAQADELALLEDRVALRQGKKQIYGSQIGYNQETGEYYVLPLIDPDNVDKRRAEVGLEPLADYVIMWDIIWDVEQYKRDLPVIEDTQKKKKK